MRVVLQKLRFDVHWFACLPVCLLNGNFHQTQLRFPCDYHPGILTFCSKIYKSNESVDYLSTKWVDYVEEPMKYQALRPQFFSVGGLGVLGWVGVGRGGGGRVGGDGVGCVVVGVQSGGGVVGGVIRLSF